jgi:hypothetical protein
MNEENLLGECLHRKSMPMMTCAHHTNMNMTGCGERKVVSRLRIARENKRCHDRKYM